MNPISLAAPPPIPHPPRNALACLDIVGFSARMLSDPLLTITWIIRDDKLQHFE